MWLTNKLFDNSDGKQARKTGTSSPLGFLMDHGLDCVTAAVLAINALCLFNVSGPITFGLCFAVCVGFYVVTYDQ